MTRYNVKGPSAAGLPPGARRGGGSDSSPQVKAVATRPVRYTPSRPMEGAMNPPRSGLSLGEYRAL
ncbi:MAG TPA: hypothetical protein VEN81_13305, partial [Planctomycetota bacterium]|nr:hypothetical protein [Planctomycetota bacterium]